MPKKYRTSSGNLQAIKHVLGSGNWITVMVQAERGAVQKKISSRHGGRAWRENWPWESPDAGRALFSVLKHDSDWTTLVYALGTSSGEAHELAEKDAMALSRAMDGRVLSFAGSDVTLTMEYRLLQDGKVVDRVSVAQGTGPVSGSKKHKKSATELVDGPLYMASSLDELGVELLPLEAKTRDGRLALGIAGLEPTEYRVDFIDLRTRPDRDIGEIVRKAVQTGDSTEVRRQILAGVPLNEDNGQSNPPIIAAIPGGPLVDRPDQTTEVLELLLSAGAELYPRRAGSNPFFQREHDAVYTAVSHRRADALRVLIRHGIDVNRASFPLWTAARWGDLEMVKLLVEAGADPLRPVDVTRHPNLDRSPVPLDAAREARADAVVQYLEDVVRASRG